MKSKNISPIDTALVRAYLNLIYPRGVRSGTEVHLLVRREGRPIPYRGLRSIDEISTAVARAEHERPELIAIRPLLFASPPASDQRGFTASCAAPDSTAESLHGAYAFFVDLDFEPAATPAQLVEAEVALRAFEWTPTFVVRSGGGLHAYWVLERAAPLRTPEQRARWEGRREALRRRLDGVGPWTKADKGSKGIAQPARLPGTWNRKPGREPVMAALGFIDGPKYRPSELPLPDFVRPRPAIDIDGVIIPDLDDESPEFIEALALALHRDDRARALWDGTDSFGSASDDDWRFAHQVAWAAYEVVGGDRERWLGVVMEAISHRRSKVVGDAKARRGDYLAKTAVKVWRDRHEQLGERARLAMK